MNFSSGPVFGGQARSVRDYEAQFMLHDSLMLKHYKIDSMKVFKILYIV